jgi:hypothetical protein
VNAALDAGSYRPQLAAFVTSARAWMADVERALTVLARDAGDDGVRQRMHYAASLVRAGAAALGLREVMREAARLERWAGAGPQQLGPEALVALHDARARIMSALSDIELDAAGPA